jgi:hypothetical protein
VPTRARGQIVIEDEVGICHCIARCVRRTFLCGMDPYTGQDYSHRKEWILDRMRELAGLFAIEVCEPSTDTLHSRGVAGSRAQLAARRRLGGANRSTSSHQVISYTRPSSRSARSQTTSSFRVGIR